MNTETKSDNGAMKTHHFILKEDGNIYIIPEMPERHDHYHGDVFMPESFDRAIERAKESAILVENKEEVITYEYHRCLEDGPDPGGGKSVNEESVFQVGELYPLECQIEVKEKSRYEHVYLGQARRVVEQVALITFSVPKPSEEQVERQEATELISKVHDHMEGRYDLDSLDMHNIHAALCKYARKSSPAHADNQEELKSIWKEVIEDVFRYNRGEIHWSKIEDVLNAKFNISRKVK